MPGLGVTDVSSGAGVVADYRTRLIGSYHEQYFVATRERVTSSMVVYTVRNAVTAAANATTTWRWFLRNPTGSGITVAVRDLYVIATHVANTIATVNAPLHTFERWTSTGTPSGGTALTPARTLSGQAPVAKFYTAAPTGLTNTRGATAFSFFPSINFTTTSAQPRAHWPTVQDYHTTDPSIELVPGEALAFRQNEAGTTSEATERYMLTNILVEEFTRPAT